MQWQPDDRTPTGQYVVNFEKLPEEVGPTYSEKMLVLWGWRIRPNTGPLKLIARSGRQGLLQKMDFRNEHQHQHF